MQLFVVTNSGTVTVHVAENDTVQTLKNTIEEQEGIPSHLQRLCCSTRTLSDQMILKDCSVDNNSTISLLMALKGGVQIHVKAIGKGSPPSFSLEMELSDTVEKLKAKIEEEHGIPPSDLKLAFRGKNLSNEALLDTINQLKSKGTATFVMTKKKNSAPTPSSEPKKESSEPAQPATLCANNCGFYGTASNGGYCSSCFKQLGLVHTEPEEEKSDKAETKTEPPVEETDPSKIQSDTTHCWKCNRKVGILGFACKCKYVFCGEHRYSDKHECSFDYKTKGIEDLTKRLERVEDKKGLHS